jgi:hypothetical protein
VEKFREQVFDIEKFLKSRPEIFHVSKVLSEGFIYLACTFINVPQIFLEIDYYESPTELEIYFIVEPTTDNHMYQFPLFIEYFDQLPDNIKKEFAFHLDLFI